MTVQIKIMAVRGTTSYEFDTLYNRSTAEDYGNAQRDAEAFEKWLNEQSDRLDRITRVQDTDPGNRQGR